MAYATTTLKKHAWVRPMWERWFVVKKKKIYLFRCNKIEKPFFPIQGDVIKSFLLFCADVEGLDFAFNSK